MIHPVRAAGRLAVALPLVLALAAPTASLVASPALARSAPESFADLAQKLLPAVVNVSTTQTVKSAQAGPGERGQRRGPEIPQFPPGSPFEEFFKEFFDRNRYQVGGEWISLAALENERIRPLGDARIHFALNRMVRGSGPLPREPFDASAPRNGASGFWPISSRRALSIVR